VSSGALEPRPSVLQLHCPCTTYPFHHVGCMPCNHATIRSCMSCQDNTRSSLQRWWRSMPALLAGGWGSCPAGGGSTATSSAADAANAGEVARAALARGDAAGMSATPAATMCARNSSGSIVRLPLLMVSMKLAAEYCTGKGTRALPQNGIVHCTTPARRSAPRQCCFCSFKNVVFRSRSA
jgi:hypothetical protein